MASKNVIEATSSRLRLTPFVGDVTIAVQAGSGLSKRVIQDRFGIRRVFHRRNRSQWTISLARCSPDRVADLVAYLKTNGAGDVLKLQLVEAALEEEGPPSLFNALLARYVIPRLSSRVLVARVGDIMQFGRRAYARCATGTSELGELLPGDRPCPLFAVWLDRNELQALGSGSVDDLAKLPYRVNDMLAMVRAWGDDPAQETPNVHRLVVGSRRRTRFEIEPPDPMGQSIVDKAAARHSPGVPARAQAVHMYLRRYHTWWVDASGLLCIRNHIDEHLRSIKAAAGSKGGKKRAETLSEERIRDIARMGGDAKAARFRSTR